MHTLMHNKREVIMCMCMSMCMCTYWYGLAGHWWISIWERRREVGDARGSIYSRMPNRRRLHSVKNMIQQGSAHRGGKSMKYRISELLDLEVCHNELAS